MPPSELTAQATNEELLRQVIEAQVKGGYGRNKWGRELRISSGGSLSISRNLTSLEGHILEILLDTDGCKAAYGEGIYCWNCWRKKEECGPEHCIGGFYLCSAWQIACHKILASWYDGSGNNVHAALTTAVSFLPSK